MTQRLTPAVTDAAMIDELLRPIWLVAFVGHRPAPPEAGSGRSRTELNACRASLTDVLQQAQNTARDAGGDIELVSCVADGADLIAVAVADQLDIPVHIVLPKPEASFYASFSPTEVGTPEEQRARDSSLLQARGYINRAKQPDSDWTFRRVEGDGSEPECFHDTNLAMLEWSDLLVVVWNEEQSNKLGGTSEAVHLADDKRLQMPTAIVNPAQAGEVTRRLAWNPTPTNAPSATGSLQEQAESMALLTELRKFVLITDAGGISIAADAKQSRSDQAQRGEGELGPNWRLHAAFDNVANNTSSHFRRTLIWEIWLHFIATVLAAIAASFSKVFTGPLKPTLAGIAMTELILVLVAIVMMWRVSKLASNHRWRLSRFAAELIDGAMRSGGLIDPLDQLVGRHDATWKRFWLAIAIRSHRQQNQGVAKLDTTGRLRKLRHRYVEQRVEYQRDLYFEKCKSAAAREMSWLGWAKMWSTRLAPWAIGLAIIIKVTGWPMSPGPIKDVLAAIFGSLTPIFFPLVVSASGALLLARDAARRTDRYGKIANRLERCACVLPLAQTPAAVKRLVLETEDLLLDELIEWNVASGVSH